jgi:hypothetical protein
LILELRNDLDDAREHGRRERMASIEDEIEAIERELKRAIGLGGRDRRAASESERARLSVTRVIKNALTKIAENDANVGALLR